MRFRNNHEGMGNNKSFSLLTLAKITDVLSVPAHILLSMPKDNFEKELDKLTGLLNELRDVKHVIFLKEVLESHLKLYK